MERNYNNIYKSVTESLKAAKSEVILISAFITSEIINDFYKYIGQDVTVTVICRFKKQDLLFGSSDLKAAKIILENDGRILRNPSLHAKLFLFDKDTLLFGSANLTNKGMGITKESNIECLSSLVEANSTDIFFVNSLIESSQIVDNLLIRELEEQLEDEDKTEYDEGRIANISSSLVGIFINDFPFSEFPHSVIKNVDDQKSIHDLQILQLEPGMRDLYNLKRKFISTKILTWLNSIVEDQVQFGELSACIHDSLLDDPKPYRKEIKDLQKNLLNWIDILLPQKYKVFIPNGYHSQVLKKM